MNRLYEEVVARLEEMGMITARILRLGPSPSYSVKFCPVSEDGAELTAAEIVSTPQSSGFYDYRAGACYRTTAG